MTDTDEAAALPEVDAAARARSRRTLRWLLGLAHVTLLVFVVVAIVAPGEILFFLGVWPLAFYPSAAFVHRVEYRWVRRSTFRVVTFTYEGTNLSAKGYGRDLLRAADDGRLYWSPRGRREPGVVGELMVSGPDRVRVRWDGRRLRTMALARQPLDQHLGEQGYPMQPHVDGEPVGDPVLMPPSWL